MNRLGSGWIGGIWCNLLGWVGFDSSCWVKHNNRLDWNPIHLFGQKCRFKSNMTMKWANQNPELPGWVGGSSRKLPTPRLDYNFCPTSLNHILAKVSHVILNRYSSLEEIYYVLYLLRIWLWCFFCSLMKIVVIPAKMYVKHIERKVGGCRILIW